MAQILDSKSLEDLVNDISNIPEVFEVFNAACISCYGMKFWLSSFYFQFIQNYYTWGFAPRIWISHLFYIF